MRNFISLHKSRGLIFLFIIVLSACGPGDSGEAGFEPVSTSSVSIYLPEEDFAEEEAHGATMIAAKVRGKKTRAPRGPCGTMTGVPCEIFLAINAQREKRGLTALRPESRCLNLSRAMANDMAENEFFSHDSPKHGGFSERSRYHKLQGAAGENIAMRGNAQTAVEGWMASPGHRRNILSARFRSTGVGYAKDPKGTRYYTQCFSSLPGN